LSYKKAIIRKILAEYYITNWKYTKRLFLTDINATKRLAWCFVRRGWTMEEWGLYIYGIISVLWSGGGVKLRSSTSGFRPRNSRKR
jgi:hypothetical protein